MAAWDCVETQMLILASWPSQDSVFISNKVLDYQFVISYQLKGTGADLLNVREF